MATVTGLTAERMLEIENATVVSGAIDVSGHLILTTHGGDNIDAGNALVAVDSATTTAEGVVELATEAETATGTDDVRAVTPAGLKPLLDAKQAADSDLTAIAGLSPSNDDVIQRKSGAWTNRSMAQLGADLLATGLFSGGGGGGTTYVPFLTIGPTSSGADLETDGTADDVQFQTAIDALLAAGGGVILVAPGTYAISTALSLVHNGTNDYESPGVAIVGSGMHNTYLIAGNNVNCISISGGISVSIKDMTIKVRGTGSGIVSAMNTTPADLYQAFWNSTFENLYFAKEGVSSHTGWAMDLGSPFRSRFTNIEVYGLHNGIRLKSEHADFNPGDCTFDRVFIELDSSTGSIGLSIVSTNSMGSMNQMTFNMVEFFDNASGGTAISFTGTGGDGGNHNIFTGINIEQFSTLVSIAAGISNRFDLNYIEAAASGSFFVFASSAKGNHIRSVGMGYVGTRTITVINDANTDANDPNILENCYLGIDSGGTANATVTTATRIRNTRGYNSGTLATALNFQKTEYGEVWYHNGSTFVRAAGARIYVGGASDPTTNPGDIWIH